MKVATVKSWVPVAGQGGTYCSPACGCRCKREDYDRAVADAAALAARLGEGWRPDVWENAGWHFSVTKGVATIGRAGVTKRYTAQLDTNPQVYAHAETPEDALGFAIQDARGIAARLAADLAALSD